MTEMLQKSENVAKNVANENSQDLTSQWKNGKLPVGSYYASYLGEPRVWLYRDKQNQTYDLEYEIYEVLAKVPSYDEWKEKTKSLKVLAEAYCKEKQQNAQLKELLKECVKMNTRLENALWQWNEESKLYDENEALENKINEVLK